MIPTGENRDTLTRWRWPFSGHDRGMIVIILKDVESTLESLKRYEEMALAYFDERESLRRKNAKMVFDHIQAYDFDIADIQFFKDEATGQIKGKNPKGEELDSLIAANLNHTNIGYFIDLILENAQSVRQAALAMKRHAENRAMKQDVFDWLDANMSRFKSMDAAAEAIAGKVAPVAFRTARDWVADWKKLRSTGTA